MAIGSLGNVDLTGNTLPVTIESGNVTVFQGTDPWVVTGNTNAVVSGTVAATQSGSWNVGVTGNIAGITGNVAGITANVTVVDGGGSLTVDGNVNATITGGNANVTLGGMNLDAFGRLRVSEPTTLFDSQNKYTDQNQFASNLVSGGTCTYNQNSNSFLLSVSGSGSSVTRETTKTFIYQPGKSLLHLNSFVMNTPTAGVTQRVGYFNDTNGVFFEAVGTTLNMVIRSYSSGSVVDTKIAQTDWNSDTLLGTGGSSNPSGIQLNPALAQLFWIDIEWLGVGSVRVGFVINGQFILCHTFHHANVAGNTNTYMGTATLPVRYQITTTGTAATMRQICTTVISEGGYTMTGNPSGKGHDLNGTITLPNDLSFKPLMSIRLKSTQPDAIVVPIDFTIVPVDQALVKYRVYNRAITSGGSWVSAGSNSSVEYNLSPTALVSGDKAYTGFLVSNNQSINTPQDQKFDFTEQLIRDPFTNTMYEYVIMAATTGTNIDVVAAVNWQEVT